jgi:hypothetical protein
MLARMCSSVSVMRPTLQFLYTHIFICCRPPARSHTHMILERGRMTRTTFDSAALICSIQRDGSVKFTSCGYLHNTLTMLTHFQQHEQSATATRGSEKAKHSIVTSPIDKDTIVRLHQFSTCLHFAVLAFQLCEGQNLYKNNMNNNTVCPIPRTKSTCFGTCIRHNR